MTEFRTVLTRRLRWLIGATCVFSLIVILTALYGYKVQSDAGDFVHGVQVGIFIGMQIIILLVGKKLRAALRNESFLKKLYIEEHDERKKLIMEKANSLSLYVTLFSVSLASIVLGFFNVTISITLFAVLIVILLTRISSNQYYNRKF
ncbi:hypothetical protein M5X11_32740 [Paenibacillus alginolyticus]|uniref:DUF2178 domain-containing protein n=1 Tax=Paenibacillus alginolyticus TaxID=59839 RepID=A0ABT4GJN3_9BACL|nr:hypothetical protein [Paenibacillus alginolyticus]MCY9669634.1 hypothetical protein [Paenibacillus alginolyticus]MCY9696413.1 hypothetical protein [Paenibacillus alginolyticus]MEC0148581.1 hypothetical protein [Paenibacillus alginolyticus]